LSFYAACLPAASASLALAAISISQTLGTKSIPVTSSEILPNLTLSIEWIDVLQPNEIVISALWRAWRGRASGSFGSFWRQAAARCRG